MKKRSNTHLKHLVNLLFVGLIFGNFITSKAATKTFTGAADGVSWHLANNWNGNTLPSAADSVVILSHDVELSTTVTVSAIYLKEELNILSSGNLTVNGSITLVVGSSALLSVDGVLTVNGAPIKTDNYTQFLVKSGGFLQINNSYDDGFFCEGELKVNIGGRLEINNAANNGLYCRGEVINNGQLIIDGAVNGIKLSTNFTTYLTNNQALFIKNCTGYGIENLGVVINNYDRLFIENTTDYSIFN